MRLKSTGAYVVFCACLLILMCLNAEISFADTISPVGESDVSTVMPDLFTGSFSYKIPIEVPPGRNGMQPKINISYNSSNQKGLAGFGWQIEMGSIVRKTRISSGRTVISPDYNGDNFIYKTEDGGTELSDIGNNTFQALYEKDLHALSTSS